MTLNVFISNNYVGTLSTTANRGIVFQYDKDYIKRNDIPLSLSLPLREKEYSQKECLPYFTGLLPEEDSRKGVCDYFNISETSHIKLLERLGGECAGSVSFYNSENITIEDAITNITTRNSFNSKNYKKISEEELGNFISNCSKRPLLICDNNLKLSLAGSQSKVSLCFIENELYIPINGSPSTHIIKPSSIHIPSISVNEYICMTIGKLFGLNVPNCILKNIDGIPVLIEERFDRYYDYNSNTINTIHIEDICQASCTMNTRKYQSDNGPSLKDTYNIIKNNCLEEDAKASFTDQFIKIIVFNYLIGNCDAHSKNFSIYLKDKDIIELAPFYDLLSTEIYKNISTNMAMKLGSEYDIEKIMRCDFTKQADLLDLKPYRFFESLEFFNSNYIACFKKIEEKEELKDYKDVVSKIKELFIKKLNKLLA